MPLTFTPDESEARRRKLYGDLAASGDKAMGYGFDALTRMETMAKEKKATERQSGLDADARAKAAADLTLRQAQEARASGADKRDSERDAFDLEQAKGKAVRDAEDRTLTLDDSKRKRTQERVQRVVTNGMANQKSPQALAAENPDLDPGEIAAAYENAQHTSLLKDQDRDLARRKTESEIAENLRPRGGAGAARVDPEIAAARKRTILANADAAEARRPEAVEAREDEKRAKEEVKLKERQVVEVNNFVANIKDNIGALRGQIKDKGTFELFGTHKQDMKRRLTNISTDLAKLADPGTAAREGEVALQLLGLLEANDLSMSNETALEILDNLEAEVEKKRANASTARGLAPASDSASDDAAIVDQVDWGAL